MLLVTIPVASGIGPVGIAPGTAARVVGHHLLDWPHAVTWDSSDDAIIWLIRIPRVLLGVVVGAGLAIAGVALQAMVRNVLAEPYLLGVTSGATTGAALTIAFGVASGLGASALSVSAFVGALGATAAVFLIARTGGRVTAIRMLLAGVMIGYLLSAATSALIFASNDPNAASSVLFWLLGTLSLAQYHAVGIAALAVAGCFVVHLLWARRFDALAIGDDTAQALGVNPSRFRAQALVVVALCVGVVVAVSGGIGFVGLVVPHIARRLVGGAHRRVFPVAALLGAIFLIWADVLARTAFQPAELPIGIVTAVLGAPFLLVLIKRFHGAAAAA